MTTTAVQKAGSKRVHWATKGKFYWETLCGTALVNALTAVAVAEIYGQEVAEVNCPRCIAKRRMTSVR